VRLLATKDTGPKRVKIRSPAAQATGNIREHKGRQYQGDNPYQEGGEFRLRLSLRRRGLVRATAATLTLHRH
jgi:hypothetical protein